MERAVVDLIPDPGALSRHVALVRDYVRARPGAHSALMAEAAADPTAMTGSLVALGAVLLDIAAGALALEPDAVLRKVGEAVAEVLDVPLDVDQGSR